jgi:phosphotriesterase-related protein
MSFVRTVLGDVPSDDLGICYAHEHVVIAESYPTEKNPDFLLDSVEDATAELRQFHADGGRAMVDCMPCGAGRDIRKLAEISRRSSVLLIAPTGLHLRRHYPKGHWRDKYSTAQLFELFVTDIEEGVDAYDYGGPIVERTTHRAGVIKVGTEGPEITSRDEIIFRAAAEAHLATGCPVITHTENGTGGMEQVELLAMLGVDLRHVVLSHVDRSTDVDYHRKLLDTKVCMEYDSAFRWKPEQGNPTADLLVALVPEYPEQLMVGMDTARRRYWSCYGGTPGLSYLLKEFRQKLETSGLTDEQIDRVYRRNPAAAYSFVTLRK